MHFTWAVSTVLVSVKSSTAVLQKDYTKPFIILAVLHQGMQRDSGAHVRDIISRQQNY